ncbi:DUF1861 family protein [Cohnella sp.]|uniref:DUF1861 family protein n=1 Tax=Cohnella sp. TaxID=1883426 RepID=UPI0035675760
MPKVHQQAQSCMELFHKFKESRVALLGEKLTFSGIGDRDVYNITAPFTDDGERVIAGRVESRDTERSEIHFFIRRDGVWVPREGAPRLSLQDPFFTKIKGELVLGGVEVFFDPYDSQHIVSWRTLFYRGGRINDLKLFAAGPMNMKDIRLIELPNGRIGVFTRPFGVAGATAVIGYTQIQSLDHLNEEALLGADLFLDQFLPSEWGGANEVHLLSNGLVGVLGHIAYYDEQRNRHYHSMTFAYDPYTGIKTPIKIIATRDLFPEGPSKKNDLADVIFSGGLQRLGDGLAVLYAGVSDAEAHRIVIPDPFDEYEQHYQAVKDVSA